MRKSRKIRGGAITALALQGAANTASELAKQLMAISDMVGPDSDGSDAAAAAGAAGPKSVVGSDDVSSFTTDSVGSGAESLGDASGLDVSGVDNDVSGSADVYVKRASSAPGGGEKYPLDSVKRAASAPADSRSVSVSSSASFVPPPPLHTHDDGSSPGASPLHADDSVISATAPPFVPRIRMKTSSGVTDSHVPTIAPPPAGSKRVRSNPDSESSVAAPAAAAPAVISPPPSASGSSVSASSVSAPASESAAAASITFNGKGYMINGNELSTSKIKSIVHTMLNDPTVDANTKIKLNTLTRVLKQNPSTNVIAADLNTAKISYDASKPGVFTMSGGTKKRKMPTRRKTRKMKKTRKMRKMMRKMMRKTMKI